ncbi:HAUS augmin-like complex subunit 3 [Hydra vulgaris]|uniref:HAUS augmin-like complex subunit 3 n=1 Tax=Hydra vulgaris TaxID=6087 RepID=UPI0032EA63AE
MSPLSLLHEELKKKLNDCKCLQKIQDEEFKCQLSTQTKQVNDMTSKCFSSFLETSKKVISLYDTNNESSQFFFQYPLDDLFAEEEKFTSALAEYTKKQFFQGISDIAETKDTSQYGLLDLSNPDTQILKGESQEEKMKHRNELLRLQSHKEISLLTAELKSKKESRDNMINGEIKTILLELEQLYSTKIIDGNCDLKIARQKYFLEKLDEVIKHLTQQSSRQHCLSLMYELELKEHRNTYYLLASVKTLLSNEIKSMESRIKLLNEPYFKDIPKNNETILSNDTFANRLYDAIVPPGDKVVLYKTYQDIADHAKQAVPLESYDELKQLKDLQTALKNVEHFLQNNYLKEGEQISSLTTNIEENLSHSELQVNEIIKDIVYKRKILSMDPEKYGKEISSYTEGSISRLYNLLRKLEKKPNDFIKYNHIIQKQVKNGIIEHAPFKPTGKTIFYMPHRAVIKEDSETTKLKVVFDASAKEHGSPSLNDCLHIGPPLPLLLNIILQNRLQPVCLTGDIKQAFLQIRLFLLCQALIEIKSISFLRENKLSLSNEKDKLVVFNFISEQLGILNPGFAKTLLVPNKPFLYAIQTTPKLSLGRPCKSFEESSDKSKKRKVSKLKSLASSSNQLLFASSCTIWRQGRRKHAKVVRNLSKTRTDEHV